MTNTPKVFGVASNDGAEPMSFMLQDEHGRTVSEPFRFFPKLRLDLVQMLASAVQLDGVGGRTYHLDVLQYAITESLADELWNAQTNEWVKIDDKQRFAATLASDRWNIKIETLGEIAMWLVTEATEHEHPTGAPKPSSAGRTTSAATSAASALSEDSPSTS